MCFQFQPTPSARRVTISATGSSFTVDISTHTLRKEGDRYGFPEITGVSEFQPTPSARRVTVSCYRVPAFRLISTHTLRKEGDRAGLTTFQTLF